MTFAFDDHVIDPIRRELSNRGRAIDVEPRVFDLLLHLIENRQRVVSKDDLIARVWGGRIVSDSALTKAINAARRAIGDDGKQQRVIRTSSRKGYRFVGQLKLMPLTDGNPVASARWAGDSSLALPNRPSIAVLPFVNLGEGPEQEYFADGLVEDIIVALTRFKPLFVIARNSSFTYKGRAIDIRQVGEELGVRYVLDGSIRKAGDRIRVTAQLLDASGGSTIWADRMDGVLQDSLDMQDVIAGTIARKISPKIEQAEIERARRKPIDSLDAYDCFFRSLASMYERTPASFSEALGLSYKAIELAPRANETCATIPVEISGRQGRP